MGQKGNRELMGMKRFGGRANIFHIVLIFEELVWMQIFLMRYHYLLYKFDSMLCKQKKRSLTSLLIRFYAMEIIFSSCSAF